MRAGFPRGRGAPRAIDCALLLPVHRAPRQDGHVPDGERPESGGRLRLLALVPLRPEARVSGRGALPAGLQDDLGQGGRVPAHAEPLRAAGALSARGRRDAAEGPLRPPLEAPRGDEAALRAEASGRQHRGGRRPTAGGAVRLGDRHRRGGGEALRARREGARLHGPDVHRAQRLLRARDHGRLHAGHLHRHLRRRRHPSERPRFLGVP
mmetsp:Transcript_85714/g.242737  ORF Transcript_85714/g.242737 Transcript_85714/m.242737 type:complete len:209 (-) Transcript_85714:422-1048(-)